MDLHKFGRLPTSGVITQVVRDNQGQDIHKPHHPLHSSATFDSEKWAEDAQKRSLKMGTRFLSAGFSGYEVTENILLEGVDWVSKVEDTKTRQTLTVRLGQNRRLPRIHQSTL